MIVPTGPWTAGHFIGGHPALDLTNTVYDRHQPSDRNELFDTGASVIAWLCAQRLVDAEQAAKIAPIDGDALRIVRSVRDTAFDALDAVARGDTPSAVALRGLFRTAGAGFGRGTLAWRTAAPGAAPAAGFAADDVPALLAALTLDALYRLPAGRLRSCPRCGWLFVDISKGSRRRWCSMSMCGNREKAMRYRRTDRTGA